MRPPPALPEVTYSEVPSVNNIRLAIYWFVVFLFLWGCATTTGSDALKAGYDAMKHNDYQKALEYFNESLKHSKKVGYQESVVRNLRNIGDVYVAMNKPQEAIEYYNQALANNFDKNYQLEEDIKRKIAIVQAVPCSLILEDPLPRFSDTGSFLPNNRLDADELAEMIVVVKNAGKGTAYETTLETDLANREIILKKNIRVGDIPPGGEREIKVDLKAGLDLSDGTANIHIQLKEKRGYDAKKVVLNVPTARLEKPDLVIVSTEINDGDMGLAKGNGNGIPESGETIELTVLIKNDGVGKAIGVNLAGMDVTGGIQWVRDSTLVGTIQPGETAKAKLAFSIPRNFEGKEIATNLKVADIRGVSDAGKAVSCAFARRSPNLQYAWKIYEKGVPVTSVVNGGEYELEINVGNKGQIAARDVSIALAATGITLARTRLDAGEIREGTAYLGQRITMSIPRTFTDHQIPLDVRISQADFGQAASSLSIPVQVKGPKLRYVGSVAGRHGNNTLERGEPGVLEIAVYNDGNLRAEGVTVRVESKDDKLKIQGTKEILVGNIPSNARSETIKFPLSTLRAIKIGNAPLDIKIEQTDFSSISTQYALNIVEDTATVIDVASEDRRKDPIRAQAGSGPSIAFMSAPGGLETSETFRLAFEVKDARNIERIDVTVNGIRQSLTEKDGMTPAASKSKQVIKNIRLNEGENRIVVTAYNVDNLSASKEMIVSRTGEEDVDVPVVTGMNNPNGVAVVIGISRYENQNIPSVDYARRDAMKVREYLVKTMGYKEANILELYDEKATVSKIKNTLNRELKRRVTPDSDVFVYFSGHGLPETNANEPFLTTYDVEPDNPGDTAYSMKELYRQLESLKARNITVVIDACFSGMTDSDSKRIIPLIKSASPVFIEVSNPLLKMRNGVVFTSSKGKQISSWYHQKQHGLFTYYFLQGLRGKADWDGSGVVTAKGMETYLSRRVPDEAMKLYSREQTPEVMGNKDMILVKFR